MVPPPPLAVEKQRRLCLTDGHEACSTFTAAVAATGGDAERSTRWALARTAPVVFESRGIDGRFGLITPGRGVGQIALVVLMIVAFAAIALGRPPDVVPGEVAGATASPSVAVDASASPTPTPRPGTPVPESPMPSSMAPSDTSSPVIPTAAPASPAVPPPTPATVRTHVVQPGDTLYGIAAQYQTTVQAIQAANGMGGSTVIRSGQVLRLP